jgi:sulfatase modifying factor 1
MLDKRLKWAFFLATLVLAGLPISGIILDVMNPGLGTPVRERDDGSTKVVRELQSSTQPPTEDMVLIQAGPFIRGYKEGGLDEKPEGQVTLDAFSIDRTEVTNAAYMAFVDSTGHRKPISRYVKHFDKLSGPSQPAVYVSWEDADAYCRQRGARLPTEAEWEKAARGPDGLLWPWGNQDVHGAANTGNADTAEFTSPVGSFLKDQSPYGVLDMGGNAMEWVADWYQEDAYKAGTANPRGPATGFYKVIKGPSWGTVGPETRLSLRLKMIPDFRDTTIGFRCAKSASVSKINGVKKDKKLTINQSSR